MLGHMTKKAGRAVLPLSILLLTTLLSFYTAAGQASPAILIPGQPTAGVLNENTFAQIFTFTANGGDVARVTATNGESLALGLLLSDFQGGLVAQTRDFEAVGEVVLEATLPATGNYFVTVLPVPGVESPVEGNYQIVLLLNPDLQAGPIDLTGLQPTTAPLVEAPAATPDVSAATEVVTLPQPSPTTAAAPVEAPTFTVPTVNTTGFQVALEWGSSADLDLEVRDSVGGALFFGNPSVASGGTFGSNVNGGCQNLVSNVPTETAVWNAGTVPTGSYEVLVYYQQGCETNAPVPFVINITYDGALLQPIQGTLLPSQVYVGSFVIEPISGSTAGAAVTSARSGVKGDETLPTSAAVLISEAQPITVGSTVEGVITSERPYQSYSFEATANTAINVTMNANSGSLDPYVAVLDPGGNLLYFNDDAGVGITNSVLSNSILAIDGTYTLVASRYGLSVGGTEGGFVLTLANAADVAALPTPDPAALGGTDQTATVATPQTAAQPQVPLASALPPEIAALNLPSGFIDVGLVWQTSADLQLLVRDPFGEAVFDDVPSVRSGGRLLANGNVNCNRAEGTPVSYIYWPIAPQPGSYEIDVWFQNECGDTTPITFTLYVAVNGQPLFTQVVTPSTPFLQGSHYITSFTIDQAGNVIPGEGGVTGLETLQWQLEAPSAIPLSAGDVINGAITLENKFDLYAFQGLAGDEVTIAMNAAPGTNLDTNLYLIGPNGGVVTRNDDSAPGENTNALINNFTLPEDGQYIIIATHYGERFGVSSGAYTLTLDQ
jgi:hypothetical protein